MRHIYNCFLELQIVGSSLAEDWDHDFIIQEHSYFPFLTTAPDHFFSFQILSRELKMCFYLTLTIIPPYLFLVLCFSLPLVSNYREILLFFQFYFPVLA